MNPSTPSTASNPRQGLRPEELLSSGDQRWAVAPQTWRERELAMPWPPELLEAFTLRMSRHGMCVSRALMMCDRRYALQQLKDRGYADRYRARGEPIDLVGVEFSREQRSVVGFEVETLPADLPS